MSRIVSIAKSANTNDKLHISGINGNYVLIELTPVNSRGVRYASYLKAYRHFRKLQQITMVQYNYIYLENRYSFYHCDKRSRS